MSSTSDSAALQLPPDFVSIENLRNTSSESIKAGMKVNVIGFVKDYQPPMETRGTDWKCTLELLDLSIKYESRGIKLTVFWPRKSMPDAGARDAVLLRNVKLQMWGGEISLQVNFASDIHILPAKQIPTSPTAATKAPWKSYRFEAGKGRVPTEIETRYIISAKDHAYEMDIPSDHEFEQKKNQATTVRHKFSLLQDVESENFYNIIGQVITTWGSGDRLTVYLSDYTSNSNFYNHVWGQGKDAAERDGDEYGYVTSKKETSLWPGPYGKMSIQLTLFDGHAEYVRNAVTVGDWVLLDNVQVKYGKTGQLEGYLRGARNQFEGKIQVRVMQVSEDPQQVDPRLKEAIGRKRDWWQKFEKQKRKYLDEEAGGTKRKNEEEPPKGNSRKRRKEKRAQEAKEAAEKEAIQRKRLDLNDNIRCISPDQPIVPLKKIFQPRILLREDKSQNISSPFTVCKYRANVRVVDYFPHKIEDFAVGRKRSEMDVLSDYSGDEDTDLEEEMRSFRSGKGFSKKTWEWRFALQVEDIDSKDSKERMWLMVDNFAAQCLLNLEDDATNLRENRKLLGKVKEQLFKLWGDLEERKSAALTQQSAKETGETPTSSFQSSASSPRPKAGEQPDLDSDDEMEDTSGSVLRERSVNIPTINGITATTKANEKLVPRNKAFTCCIQQYGVKVKEDDPTKANAGPGRRWQRVFGLFGTQIS